MMGVRDPSLHAKSVNWRGASLTKGLPMRSRELQAQA